ncbi:MAG: hypothetical protein KIT62_08655 [Cyclobacteriaceae bacterium]|nr:hypothetical protein [Cyclobacteriaceae bacterium]
MQRYYIIEALFVLLGAALLVAIIKYPKDIFFKLPLEIVKLVLSRIWDFVSFPFIILSIPLYYFAQKYNWGIAPALGRFIDWSSRDGDDEPYASAKNLNVSFEEGDKHVYIINSGQRAKELIQELLEALTQKHIINEFLFTERGNGMSILFPKHIHFYDFHLLVQHLSNELGTRNSFGIYKSEKLGYYVFQDNKTANNLIGYTNQKKLFSIYMLDDFEEQYLKLNQRLKVETGWIERLDLAELKI